MPDLSVVIVSFNTRKLLAECLDTLICSTRHIDAELIVVDNASGDGSPDMLRADYPSVNLIASEHNLGFAGANNRGIEASHGPVVLLLNSDAFVNPDAITSCLHVLRERPEVGLVGVKVLNLDGSIQFEAGRFPSLWSDVSTSLGLDQLKRDRRRPSSGSNKDADWVHGACMFVRREAITDSGSLDETFFMYSEEVEWCYRFWQRGWRVVYLGDASVVHLGGSSSMKNDLSRRVWLYRSRLGMRRKLGGPLSSIALWLLIVSGIGIRIPLQWLIRALPGQSARGHGPGDDWGLLRNVLAMDPFSKWAVTD